ncbi:MAG TPA: CoA transferase [Dehalococcoidia bacterium]|nr:CoA transferase [Dehalococcoidia bacterium]
MSLASAPPLHGVKVIEMASWMMAPSAAAILAAYGADVVKVEPAGGADASRGNRPVGSAGPQIDLSFEAFNGGKRAIQLNIGSQAGRGVLHRILEKSDVFITNVRLSSLEKYGLDPDSLLGRFPALIYALATGYGPKGPDRDRPAFDELAYWARGGIAEALATDDGPPVQLSGAMGDLPSGTALVAGIMMALFRREREGVGGVVDVSLYGAGLWANALRLQRALHAGEGPLRGRSRLYRGNPLYTIYRCRDGKWIQFAMFQAGRFWPLVCRAIDRPDLTEDERFSTPQSLLSNSIAAIQELQMELGKRTVSEWAPIFDSFDFPWSPVFDGQDIANDEQARANGYVVSKQHRSGQAIKVIAPPFQLRGVDVCLEPAPETGQHTEEVMLEAGFSWDDISAIREAGGI